MLSRDVFEERLTVAFGAKAIDHEVRIVGASGKEWYIDAAVMERGRIQKLFEFVTPRSASIAAAVMKFTDIRAAERPPNIIVSRY